MPCSLSQIEMLIDNRKEAFKEICLQHYIQSLYVFGSAFTDAFYPESDVDLLYQIDLNKFEKQNHTDGFDYIDNLLNFEKEMSEFFNRKIDLVPDVFISNKYLKEEIEKTKHQIYAA